MVGRKHCSEVSKTIVLLSVFFIWSVAIFISTLYLFSTGFLLTRQVDSNGSSNHSIGTSADGRGGIFDKVIILIVDALRYDFLKKHDSKGEKSKKLYANNVPIVDELISSGKGRLYKFIADPPTTTLQRLKGLTTGSLPTFIDMASNFGSFLPDPSLSYSHSKSEFNEAVREDNWIFQAMKHGKTFSFAGDETWNVLYPTMVSSDPSNRPLPSFNVPDLDSVDEGVKEHLLSMFRQGNNNNKKDSMRDVYIGHMLGVDHVGHTFSPNHIEMRRKLVELDDLIRTVVAEIEKWRQEDCKTVFIVMGDHGMTDDGDHGGDSENEVNAAFFVYSQNFNFDIQKDETSYDQIDFVPTVSAMLGIPIPSGSIGKLMLDVVNAVSNASTSRQLMEMNVKQVFEFVQKSKLENSNRELSMLTTRFASSPPDFTESDFDSFIEDVKRTFRKSWTTFDMPLMLLSMSLMFSHLLLSTISVNSAFFPSFITLKLVVQLLVAFYVSNLFSLANVPMQNIHILTVGIAFSLITFASSFISSFLSFNRFSATKLRTKLLMFKEFMLSFRNAWRMILYGSFAVISVSTFSSVKTLTYESPMLWFTLQIMLILHVPLTFILDGKKHFIGKSPEHLNRLKLDTFMANFFSKKFWLSRVVLMLPFQDFCPSTCVTSFITVCLLLLNWLSVSYLRCREEQLSTPEDTHAFMCSSSKGLDRPAIASDATVSQVTVLSTLCCAFLVGSMSKLSCKSRLPFYVLKSTTVLCISAVLLASHQIISHIMYSNSTYSSNENGSSSNLLKIKLSSLSQTIVTLFLITLPLSLLSTLLTASDMFRVDKSNTLNIHSISTKSIKNCQILASTSKSKHDLIVDCFKSLRESISDDLKLKEHVEKSRTYNLSFNDTDDSSSLHLYHWLAYHGTSIVFVVLLLIVFVSGIGVAPSIHLVMLQIVFLAALRLSSHNFYTSPTSFFVITLSDPFLVIWTLHDTFSFYATYHSPTISAIPWNSAFVGVDSTLAAASNATFGAFNEESNFWSPMFKILTNVCAGQILHAITLPLIQVVLNAMHSEYVSRVKRFNRNGTSTLLKSQREELLTATLDQSSLISAIEKVFICLSSYITLHAIRLFLCMIGVTILRRHLTVWKMFAPRFMYESVFFICTSLVSILSFLICSVSMILMKK